MGDTVCAVQWSDPPCVFAVSEVWHVCVRPHAHDGKHECSCLSAVEPWEWEVGR